MEKRERKGHSILLLYSRIGTGTVVPLLARKVGQFWPAYEKDGYLHPLISQKLLKNTCICSLS